MDKIKSFLGRPQVWGFFVSMAVMAIISLAFFYPDNFEGNSLQQPDMKQGFANGREASAFEAETGEKALWTNALFGGMPTFQISPSYPSNSLFTWINDAFGLWLPAPSNLLFMMMFGFFILMMALKKRWYFSLIGAMAWGLSSYFIIIIGAGHIWKFLTLTYVPPTIAGFILLYRGNKLRGASLLALFAMMQLNANHPQMTYYFGLMMVVLAIAFLVDAIRHKTLRRWIQASAIALGCGALALGANAPSLYNTYEYSKETKRSQSELSAESPATPGETAEKPTGGLAKSDILGWSYGRTEMLSFLIPNIKGGASARPEGGQMSGMTLDLLEDAPQYASTSPILPYLTQYFNDSEGTNGPVYAGALILAFFLLGCAIIGGPLKWGLVASTIMAVLLSLGYNAEWLSDLMIYHFPLYNKFRAVESILVVAEFCIPLLAVLAMAEVFETGAGAWARWRKPMMISAGIPAVLCLAAIAFPGIYGSAINETDRNGAEQIQRQLAELCHQNGYTQAQASEVLYQYSLSNPANITVVTELRHGLVRADGWRSLLFLLLGAGIVALYISRKVRMGVAVGGVGVLVLADLYGVDKRYVSHSSFGARAEGGMITFVPDDVDRYIRASEPAGSHYRVLDIPGFFTADRSYFHSTVGGYHAAKLNRYEDLIRRKLMPVVQIGWFRGSDELDNPEVAEIASRLKSGYAVADMLNSRYIVTGDPAVPVVENEGALGNAWLIDSLLWVEGADAEMAALDASRIDLSHQAVADRRFADALPAMPRHAEADTIFLTSYTPNTLKYDVTTADGGVAVFSEVWFPWGWHATIDGAEAPLARVNYILRALAVPAGHHEITMTFAPASIRTSSALAYACVTLIYLLVLSGIFVECRRYRLF